MPRAKKPPGYVPKRETDEEIVARQEATKQRKREKNMRRKVAKGGKNLSESEYAARRAEIIYAEQRNRDARQNLTMKVAPQEYVPEELRKVNWQANDPSFVAFIRSGYKIDVLKTDPLYRARAVWFNDLDKKRSFSFDHKQARLLVHVLIRRWEGGEKLHLLELAYLAAVVERKVAPNSFVRREDFVEMWRGSEFELYVFRQCDFRAFKKMEKTLADVVPEVDEEDPRAVSKQDMVSMRGGTSPLVDNSGVAYSLPLHTADSNNEQETGSETSSLGFTTGSLFSMPMRPSQRQDAQPSKNNVTEDAEMEDRGEEEAEEDMMGEDEEEMAGDEGSDLGIASTLGFSDIDPNFRAFHDVVQMADNIDLSDDAGIAELNKAMRFSKERAQAEDWLAKLSLDIEKAKGGA